MCMTLPCLEGELTAFFDHTKSMEVVFFSAINKPQRLTSLLPEAYVYRLDCLHLDSLISRRYRKRMIMRTKMLNKLGSPDQNWNPEDLSKCQAGI